MRALTRAVILAAGRGMRMMPLTDVIPKPMAPYRGSTLIAERISSLKDHMDEVFITVGYKGAMLASHVIEHDVSAVINTEGKGNAWWLYNSLLSLVDGPLLVLTCDNIVDLDFDLLEGDYYRLGEPPCMVVPVRPVPGLDGDYIFHENNCVQELTRERTADIYCSGMQVLNPRRIGELTRPTEDFGSVWGQLMENRYLWCSTVYPERWTAVDTLEQLSAAGAMAPFP